MRILDLFCGAGGASKGYSDAGFEIVGVDILPQKHYPFEFHQWDALQVLAWLNGYDNPYLNHQWRLSDFDAIHASPPCQAYSDLAKRNGKQDEYPDLIRSVRELLIQTGLPYVIENVEGAPLIDPIILCGSVFELGTEKYRLKRHRLFETNWGFASIKYCRCDFDKRPVIDVSGGGPQRSERKIKSGGLTYKGTIAERREAMGIDWMTRNEINQAIPPAYTEYIGKILMDQIRGYW